MHWQWKVRVWKENTRPPWLVAKTKKSFLATPTPITPFYKKVDEVYQQLFK